MIRSAFCALARYWQFTCSRADLIGHDFEKAEILRQRLDCLNASVLFSYISEKALNISQSPKLTRAAASDFFEADESIKDCFRNSMVSSSTLVRTISVFDRFCSKHEVKADKDSKTRSSRSSINRRVSLISPCTAFKSLEDSRLCCWMNDRSDLVSC